MAELKSISKLHQSSIVANSLMNRERILSGGNSYEKELSFNISDYLKQRLSKQKSNASVISCKITFLAIWQITGFYNSLVFNKASIDKLYIKLMTDPLQILPQINFSCSI